MKKIYVRNPNGEIGKIPEQNKDTALTQGFTLLTQEEIAKHKLDKELSQPVEQVKAAGQAVLDSLTFGISSHFAKYLSDIGAPIDMKKYKARADTDVYAVSEFGGDIASLLLGGAAAKGVGLVGKAAAKKGIKEVAKRGAKRGIFEGGALEIGDITRETALSDNPALNAENMIKRVGASMALGGIIDGSFSGLGAISKSVWDKKIGKKIGKKVLDNFGVPKDIDDAFGKVLGASDNTRKTAYKELKNKHGGMPGVQKTIDSIEKEHGLAKKIIGWFDSPVKIKENLIDATEEVGNALGTVRKNIYSDLEQIIKDRPDLAKQLVTNPKRLVNKLNSLQVKFINDPDIDKQKLSEIIKKQGDSILELMSRDNSFENMVKTRIKLDKSMQELKVYDSVTQSKIAKKEVRNAFEESLLEDLGEMVKVLKDHGISTPSLLNAPSRIRNLKNQYSFLKDIDKVIGKNPKDPLEKLNLVRMVSNPFNVLKYGGFGLGMGPFGALLPLAADTLGPKLPSIYANLVRSGIKLPKVPMKMIPKVITQRLEKPVKLGKKLIDSVDLAEAVLVGAIIARSEDLPEAELDKVNKFVRGNEALLEGIVQGVKVKESRELIEQLKKENEREEKVMTDTIKSLNKQTAQHLPSIKYDNYNKTVEKLRELEKNPDIPIHNLNAISRYTSDAAPSMTMEMQSKMMQISDFLFSKIPQSPLGNVNMFFKQETPISDLDKRSFMKSYTYVFNPNEAIKTIASGNVDPEAIEVLQVLYPATIQKFKELLIENSGKVQNMPFEKRKSLSIALGIPLDPAFQFIDELQSIYQQEEIEQPGGQLRQTNMQLSENAQTDVEKVST